jgi:DNA-directed RNA polymerase subunit L
MYISDYTLVNILREKMGEQEAIALVEYIETKVEQKFVEAGQVFATKEDLLKLEMRIQETILKGNLETQKLIADLKTDTQKQFGEVHKQFGEIHKQFGEVQKQFGEVYIQFGVVQKQIEESKADTLKWMITLIISSTLTILGVMLVVMKMGGW